MTALDRQILSAIEGGLRKERSAHGVCLRSDSTIFGRASTVSKDCLRALWYEARGVEGEAFSLGAELTFDNGNMWHDRIRDWLCAAGLDVSMDEHVIQVNAVGLRITGHIDGVLKINGENYLYDIKSASDYGFKKAGTEGEDTPYSRQTRIYARGLLAQGVKLAGAFLLYIAKDKKQIPSGAIALRGLPDTIDLYVKIVPVPLNDLETPITRLDAIRASEPPDRLPAEEENTFRFRIAVERSDGKRVFDDAAQTTHHIAILPWQCAYCRWIKTCRPDADAALHRSSGKGKEWFERTPLTAGPFDSWKVFEKKGE